jgi:hypothetical protein
MKGEEIKDEEMKDDRMKDTDRRARAAAPKGHIHR